MNFVASFFIKKGVKKIVETVAKKKAAAEAKKKQHKQLLRKQRNLQLKQKASCLCHFSKMPQKQLQKKVLKQ